MLLKKLKAENKAREAALQSKIDEVNRLSEHTAHEVGSCSAHS